MKRIFLLASGLLVFGVGYAVALTSPLDGFFDEAPTYEVLNYGPEWRYRDMVLHQMTGHVIIVWERVDSTGVPVGEYSFHYRKDTLFSEAIGSLYPFPEGSTTNGTSTDESAPTYRTR